MGYHNVEIKKGIYREWSKVEEEIDEILDSINQQLKPMLLIELCDCLGALRAFFIPEDTKPGFLSYQEMLFELSIKGNKYSQYKSIDIVIERFKTDLIYNKSSPSVINVTKSILDFVEIYFNDSISFIDLIKFSNKTSEVKEQERLLRETKLIATMRDAGIC